MLYQLKRSPGPKGYQVTGNDLGPHWLYSQAAIQTNNTVQSHGLVLIVVLKLELNSQRGFIVKALYSAHISRVWQTKDRLQE